jgi:hypothetical protein
MIDLTVPGHAEPEQDRNEIARLLKEYGVGAVCLLRNGWLASVIRVTPSGYVDLGPFLGGYHCRNGGYQHGAEGDIIRVFPPGTRLRVTVEVAE